MGAVNHSHQPPATSAHGALGAVPEDKELKEVDIPTGRCIVVAIDCSETSHQAFNWALQNLSRPGDSVVLLHARPTHQSGGTGCGNEDGYQLAVEQMMERISRNARDKYMVTLEHVIRAGDPREVILGEVVLHDAVALVMGSRSVSRIKRAFLGSVSDYCARHSDCPVIIVRDKET